MREREKMAAYAPQWVEWERVCASLREIWQTFPDGFSMPLVTRGGKEAIKSTHWWYSPWGTKNAPADSTTGAKKEGNEMKGTTEKQNSSDSPQIQGESGNR